MFYWFKNIIWRTHSIVNGCYFTLILGVAADDCCLTVIDLNFAVVADSIWVGHVHRPAPGFSLQKVWTAQWSWNSCVVSSGGQTTRVPPNPVFLPAVVKTIYGLESWPRVVRWDQYTITLIEIKKFDAKEFHKYFKWFHEPFSKQTFKSFFKT